jgi:hypothetical protein
MAKERNNTYRTYADMLSAGDSRNVFQQAFKYILKLITCAKIWEAFVLYRMSSDYHKS